MPSELTTIATFATAAEASPVRTTLEENGIRTYIQGGTTADTLWHIGTAIGGVELQVASADVSKARECLGWTESADSSKPVDAWTCGSCGEGIDAGFEVCWNCGAGFGDEPRPRAIVDAPQSPDDDEHAVRCPMCGAILLEDAEECRNCGERLDGVSFDDPTVLNSEGEESEEAQRLREVLT